MDYEKKYKEAVCNIQKLLENGRKEGEVICAYEADFMSIFPELADSEDERIRKAILEHIQLCTESIPDRDKFIAWIEKQGTPAKLSEEEQNRFAKGVLSSCALSFIDYLDAHKYEGKMCVSNGECEDIENAFHNAMWDKLHRYYGKYIEKQGKKNPYKEDFGDLLMDVKFGIDPSPKQGEQKSCKSSGKHHELEEFAKIVRCNLTGISKSVQQLFEAKYLQLTGNKMYEGFKD